MIQLRENEQRTLAAISKLGGKADVSQIMGASDLAHASVMRAELNLSKHKLIKTNYQDLTIATLTDEGRTHAKRGLPERRLATSLSVLGDEATIGEAVERAKLRKELVPIAIGWLCRKGWAMIKGKKVILKASKKPEKGDDEKLLELMAAKDAVVTEELIKREKTAAQVLQKRKLLVTSEKTVLTLELTPKGQSIVEKGSEPTKEVSQLTPSLIVTRGWKGKKLRRFNVVAPGPSKHPAKLHPLQQIIERAREIFLQMGFTEIRGPLIETAFWNFDALFQPQDHPAREMQDTFYLSSPRSGRLPPKSVVDAVAETHENGWITNSRGWGYKWSPKEAKRLVLRTHTTAETIKHLSKHKKPPIKVFSVDRVYRNEQLTYKHTAEFHQIEGIVLDKGVTLRDLMGTLKAFYDRLGLKKVQFWPCYFPYTEPSAQAMFYIRKLKQWIELCGMGMFRPEVLIPMGIKYPVLAWGGGLERIAMIKLGLDDIRLLYRNQLNWIRSTPMCQ